MVRITRCALALLIIPLWAARAIVPQSGEPRDSTKTAQIGLLPLPIFYYTPETGFAGGGALLFFHRLDRLDTLERPSTASLNLIYTQKKQIIAELNPDIYLDHTSYRIAGTLSFVKYPQKFFGIGNNTPDSLEELYTSRAFRLTFDAVRRLAGGISGGISFFYETRTLSAVQPGGLLESGAVMGNRGGTTLGIGATLHWDTRDNIFLPSKGRYYQISLRTSSRRLGADFDFSRLALDLREYISVTATTIVAVQAVATLTNGSAPFHKLAELGGQNIMRGYYEGRYRDNKLLAAQVEYRVPIYWRFGGVLFAGAGDVAPTLSRFTLKDVKPSYGFGLRFMFDPEEKLNLRFDFGFGRNTSGFYITATESF